MRLYQIDAFTDKLFGGNPAAVCLLDGGWLPDAQMLNIAAENNLSETAFVRLDGMEIRWFTPVAEVDLCGHATLAAAHALFTHENVKVRELAFTSRRGILKAVREENRIVLDFPRDDIYPVPFTEPLDCFGMRPAETLRGTEEYLLVFETEDQIASAVCDLKKAAKIDLSGFIITARSDRDGVDFVSRYFSPKFGLDEDPVTGSAHTLLVPYWQGVLGKDTLCAKQISKRGGTLYCKAEGARVKIGGQAVTFFAGEIYL